MNSEKILILGAGISGLGAAYSCKQRGVKTIILEKNNTYGGLCGNFTIRGYRFDHFVHFSFTKEKEVIDIFNESTEQIITHISTFYSVGFTNKGFDFTFELGETEPMFAAVDITSGN